VNTCVIPALLPNAPTPASRRARVAHAPPRRRAGVFAFCIARIGAANVDRDDVMARIAASSGAPSPPRLGVAARASVGLRSTRAPPRARAHGAERRLNTSRRPIDTSTSDDSRVPPALGVHAEAEKIFRESADRARARASTTRESTTRRGATPDARRGRESVIVTAV
tara:strand:- start:96 stop:596 length:501 start_codon:yes stop_codon:yes gene_type:complete